MQRSSGSHDAQLSGTRDCGDIQWMVGRAIRGTRVCTKLLFEWSCHFFLPADSLCKPEATKRKSGSTLTTHHLIPDFWSVPHILINSCILGEYTSALKWDWRQQYLSPLNCYKLQEYDGPKLNLGMVVEVKEYIFANAAYKQLYQRCPKRDIN